MRYLLALLCCLLASCNSPPKTDVAQLSACIVGGGCFTMTQRQLTAAVAAAYKAGLEAGHDNGEQACSINTGDWYRYLR